MKSEEELVNKSEDGGGKPLTKEKVANGLLSFQTIAVFFVLTVFTCIIIEQPQPSSLCNNDTESSIIVQRVQQQPKYTIYTNGKGEEHLVHVLAVLERIGYQRTTIESMEWDIMWAHDYPFSRLKPLLNNLKSHQKINHFPGCGYLTNKLSLSITGLPYQLKAFQLPNDKDNLMQYITENPEKIFVEKDNEHRHIYIRNTTELNLTSNSTFVQEYLRNPYLVDGYKFDIGIYVVITSINPLRVYIYQGDVLFRYCPEKYHPFDPNNLNKYVVGDDYLPTWDVPSLRKYFKTFGFSMKDSFDAYVRSTGKDPSTVWDQVDDIISDTILTKEKLIVNSLKAYNVENFFEMMRFDLLIDEDLNVILIEANMSPNLSSAHFKENKLLYEQVIYNYMNLVGVASSVKRESLQKLDDKVEDMMSSDKNLVVDVERCVRNNCDINCKSVECELCNTCLSGKQYKILERTYREHVNKMDMKRVFPKPIKNLSTYDVEEEVKNLSPQNAFITKWFYEKCKMNSIWCT